MLTPDWMRRFVVIDTETTGLEAGYDRILEIGFALFENGRWVNQGDFFVNPEGRVVGAVDVHGITVDMVMNAPPFWQVFNEILPNLYGATPVAYNGSFDRRFILDHVMRAWPRSAFAELPPLLDPQCRWIDVCGLARMLLAGTRRNFKLTEVAADCGFSTDDAHRADVDAKLTGSLLLHFINQWRLDWSYWPTIDRARRAEHDERQRRFWWDHKKRPDRVWVPKGMPILVYECDVCHQQKAGVYLETGWTKPEGWVYFGPVGSNLVACSTACENGAGWLAGGRGF